jgi:hypothetical protein
VGNTADAEDLKSQTFLTEGHASAIKHHDIQMKNRHLTNRLTWAVALFLSVALVLLSTNPTMVNVLKRLLRIKIR